ncbi:MAG: fibronectin type III domain-containing protein, partial [Candidatus Cloacimonetes bacterium]|nr:fibronectin type III domain-containing protein [Candidatus Cloacimonadota bacterium]
LYLYTGGGSNGYDTGISNMLYINTGGGGNGYDTGISNTIAINTLIGQYGYGISGPIELNTEQEMYSSYRIVPVSQAPNPSILEIPEGGYGYAWFAVEGMINGVWLPATGMNLTAEDGQGNIIACETSLLPYQFLSSILHMQNLAVFAVPIPADIIGNGTPNSIETITIMTANGVTIAPENQLSIVCKIIPYTYSANWGYRLYAKGGGGVTGGIVTVTGFAGGGSGATISLDLQGLGTNPTCTAFRIKRRDDVFVGAEVELGPPRLIDVGTASTSVQASFPYEYEVNFDLDQMEGLEALLAFYLFAEPTVLYATNSNQVVQLSARFLELVVQALIANSANNGLGISRVSDEVGLDIQGNLDLSTNLLAGSPLRLKMGPGLGLKAHLGGSLKMFPNDSYQTRINIGGEYKTSLNIGPKLIPNTSIGFKYFYPQRLNNAMTPSSGSIEYEMLGKWDSPSSWDSIQLSSKYGSTLPSFKIYDLPGQMQEYKSWVELNSMAVRNMLLNVTQTPSQLLNIGSAAVNMITNNETFSQDITNFMGTVYEQQNRDLPVQLAYGNSCEDKSAFNLDLDMEFPLPVFPALVIKLGTGFEATNSRDYEVSKGYWVKGYPYLQTEMPSLPQNNIAFSNVINTMWNKLTQGNIWNELCSVIASEMYQSVLRWWPFKNRADELLNPNGSYITLIENSIPAGVDSVQFRYWDWGDEPAETRLTATQRVAVKKYNRNLRKIRESNVGMHYGIGGFYRFEANSPGWNVAPPLTIKYLDSELAGINESTLKMYWEDETGNWHLVPSTAVPDSNLVRANIPYFTTYTLAPSLPQGSINLDASPDSLAADGSSTTNVTTGSLTNNDGTLVANGTEYTILLDRGEIVDTDINPSLTGKQVAAFGGSLCFTVQADSIPLPITASISSVTGYASGSLEIPLYATGLPATPLLISCQPEHRAISLSWQQVNEPGVIGYKIYYDTDNSGIPYNGTASVNGINSPVVLGNLGAYTLTGLNNNQDYYIAITALDAAGNESLLSNEMQSRPVLRSVTNLEIDKQASGIKLSWNPAYGATSYKIYRSSSPNLPLDQMQFVAETTSTNWLDNTATTNKNFYLIISIGQ